MPVARVRAPDGTIVRVEVPEGASPEEIQSYVEAVATNRLLVPGQGPRGQLPDVALDPETAARFTPPEPAADLPRAEARLTPEPTSPAHAFAQSALTELARAGQGVRATWNLATMDIPERQQALRTMGRLRGEQAERRREFPVSTIAGELSPYIGIPQAAVSTLPRAAVTGAALGGATSGGEALGAGLGALGGAGGYAIGRALARPASQLNPFEQRAIEAGRQIGLRASPYQQTGSSLYRRLEASLDSNILTQGALGRLGAQNQEIVNAVAARSIGEASTAIDDLTLGSAASRMGAQFNRIADKYPSVPVDDVFLNRIGEVESDLIGDIVGTDAEKKIAETITRILGKVEDGTLTGRQIRRFSSKLKKTQRRMLKGEKMDEEAARAYGNIANAFDELLERHATPRDAGMLADLRGQWRNLVYLEQPGVVRGGNLSPRVLANVLRRQQKTEYQRGGRQGTLTPTDQLYTAARFAEALPPLPTSGTAERLSLPVTMGGVGSAWAATGDPALGVALGAAGPAALSRLYGRWPFVTGVFGLPAAAAPYTGGAGARIGAPIGASYYGQ